MSKHIVLLFAVALCLVGASAMHADHTRGSTFALTKEAFANWLCAGSHSEGDCRGKVGTETLRTTVTRVVDRITGADGRISGLEDFLHRLGAQYAPLQSFLASKKPTSVSMFRGLINRVKSAWGTTKREHALGFMCSLRDDLVAHAAASNIAVASSDPIPFEILPQFLGSVDAAVSKKNQTFSTKCFPKVVVSTTLNTAAHTLTVQVDLSAGAIDGCSSQILFAPGNADIALRVYEGKATPQSETIVMNIASIETSTNPAAELWYFQTRGLRLYEIRTGNVIESIVSVIDTVVLLLGFAEQAPSGAVFDASYDFVRNFVQADVERMGPKITMRTAGDVVARNLDPNTINSGDLFILLRPDGLDPMIGWGEGSLAGHSVIAVRPPGQGLHICESTTLDAYWPTNGIQCNPWEHWLSLCEGSLQNVVHVPMKPEYLQKFNVSAAMAFFEAHKAVDYGFQTFVFGWIDTATGNFPCTPHSNYTVCMDPQVVEMIALFADTLFGSDHKNIFRQALAHRVNLWTPTSIPPVLNSIYHGATVLNKNFVDIYQIPEEDSWLYNTTQNGTVVVSKSMVCCVFVCNMWKAAGIFSEINNQVQCGEQTLWDIYSMALFDSTKMNAGRPEVCKNADPTNPLCQIMGNFTMNLVPDVNTRGLYPNMGEKCAALAPAYVRPNRC